MCLSPMAIYEVKTVAVHMLIFGLRGPKYVCVA